MRVVACCLALAPVFLTGQAAAQSATVDWAAQKCATYQSAWNQALEVFGSDGMNYAFIAGNENFIAGACIDGGRICPQSSVEIEVANVLTLAMMNAGAASTFLPFGCTHPEPGGDGWTGPGL